MSAPADDARPVVAARHVTLVAYLFVVVMLGATLPTPLYAFYTAELGLTPLLVSLLFVGYAVGVLIALIGFGRLSDHVGRRPVLVVAVLVSAASSLVFVGVDVAPSIGLIAVGRVVSGLSAGLMTGTATAYLSELGRGRPRPERIVAVASASNTGGLALGTLLAGVLAEHLPGPTLLPYLVHLALLAPAFLLLTTRPPETVGHRDGWLAGSRPQRLGVPAQIRVPFLAAALAALASFSLLGFGTSLTGSLLTEGLGDRSHQTVGFVSFLLVGASVVGQVVAGYLPNRTANLVGLGITPIGVAAVILAVVSASLPLTVAAFVVAGFGVGLTFRTTLGRVTAIAPDDRRAEVISTYFVVAYTGLTVPVIGAGALVTTTTLLTAVVALAGFVTALAGIAGLIVVRSARD